MSKSMKTHKEWCIVRFAFGRFERARDGYKTPENARKGIPSVAKEYQEKTWYDRNATYAIGQYIVGNAIVCSPFERPRAA